MKSISLKRYIAAVGLLSLLLLSLISTPLGAQQPAEREGVGISPTKLTLSGDPGAQLEGKFKVLNTGTSPVKFRTYVKDFRITDEDYSKEFEPNPGAASPVDWITIPTNAGELEAGAQKDLDYKISIPKDAVPQGYYAVIFAETAAPEPDSTGVSRVKRVGSLVYLTVNGGTVEKGSIASFDVGLWQRERPVLATTRVRNEGNVHFDTSGTVRMKNIFGKTVADAEFTGTTIPSTTRKYTSELKLSQPFGIFRVEGDVEMLGNTTKLPSKWVIVGSPFWILLWAFIILAWALVIIRWVVRRAKRKKA